MASTDYSANPLLVLDPGMPLPDGRCIWWKLPREVRDMVYETAYATGAPMKITTRDTFDYDQQREARAARIRGYDFTPPPFSSYVDRFLVCKRYAAEARAAFVSATHFDFDAGLNPFNLIYSESGSCGSFYGATKLTIELNDLAIGARAFARLMPQLKSLRIAASDGAFDYHMRTEEKWNAVDIRFDTISPATVRRNVLFKDFEILRGLKKVEFVNNGSKWCGWDVPADCKQKFEENVEIIKGTLTKSLMRPKTSMEEAKMYDTIPSDENVILAMMQHDFEGVARWIASARKRLKTLSEMSGRH